MQNIYIGSRNISIQWFSNEEHIIPPKDNPNQDIYAPDFYDKTGRCCWQFSADNFYRVPFAEFETILTSVELDKVLGKSKRMILPEEELARVKKILQRSQDKAEGKLVDIELTEDNPDGLDISLYKGEDQLDEIEKRKSVKEKKTDKEAKKPKAEAPAKNDATEDPEPAPEAKPESKKGRGRPKKDSVSEKVEQKETVEKKETGVKRERRKASKTATYDHEAYDFLEEDDDEVMPAPKKRKSQDSVADKESEDKKADKKEEESSLSTSERAILAEKEKTEDKPEDSATSQQTTDNNQTAEKKRGRKPKAK